MFELKSNGQKDPKNQKGADTDIPKMAKTLRDMNQTEIPTDVMGSYTGTARDGDTPEQDADDL